MKTFINIATGERFPAHGCSHSFNIREKQFMNHGRPVVKTTLEIFERGRGVRKDKLKNWAQEEIPDFIGPFPNPNDAAIDAGPWKEYVAKYGLPCAREFLKCCDYMKPTWAFQIFNPPEDWPTAVARAWFKSIFGVDPLSLAVPVIMLLLNKYSFDILAFERLLSRRFGYPKDQDGVSIKSFITKKWDAQVCAYFENHFLKT